MIKFEKISKEQFLKDTLQPLVAKVDSAQYEKMKELIDSSNLIMSTVNNTEKQNDIYDSIRLPHRATKCSAGYDFYSPIEFSLEPRQTLKIATGIRAILPSDKVLMIAPRSGLGFKYRLQLDNTIGVIDADYSQSDNEGHIWIKMTNDSTDGKALHVKQGEAVAQGIIIEYCLTDDDQTDGVRNGGFGSTTEAKDAH